MTTAIFLSKVLLGLPAMVIGSHFLWHATPLVDVGGTFGTNKKSESFDIQGEAADLQRQRTSERYARAILELESARPGELPPPSPQLRRSVREVHKKLTATPSLGYAEPSLCGVCRNMKAVTPEGDIFPCHRYVGMEKCRLGNMFDKGIDQERLASYYRGIFASYEKECAPCWLRHLCGGQCAWYLADKTDGTTLSPNQDNCNRLRDGWEQVLGFYLTLKTRFPIAFDSYIGTAGENDDDAERE